MSISSIISNIAVVAERFGALGVFLATLTEEIIAPIPSALTLLASGFFVLPSGGSFVSILDDLLIFVVLPATLGLTLGSLVLYGLAYYGGEPIVKRFGKWFGVKWEDIIAFKERFTSGYADELIVFFLRAVPIVPNVVIAVGCGAIRYPLKSFFVASVFGNAVRAFFMGALGWLLGEAYFSIGDKIQGIENTILYVFIAIVVVVIFWHLFQKKIGSKRVI